MNSLNLIVDYRGAFYSSTTNRYTLSTMNVKSLVEEFGLRGIKANIIGFPEVDLRRGVEGEVFVYPSSEDPGLHYKSYIEDLVYALELAGAHVVPAYRYLRAHHNKVFMECLRDILGSKLLGNLHSAKYGTLEDCVRSKHSFPLVIKSAAGAGSSGVRLARSAQELHRQAARLSCSMNPLDLLKELVRRFRWSGYVPHSWHRKKFLCQEFIVGLQCDFKVLVYGNRVYTVRREVRPNDFRASGSGLLSWPAVLPPGLLNFAWNVFQKLDVAHVSLDIAVTKDGFAVLEMQFVQFGPAGLEKSPHHFVRDGSGWKVVVGPSKLEKAFAEGIVTYCQRKGF